MRICNLIEEIKAHYAFRKMVKMLSILSGNNLPKTQFSKSEIVIFTIFYLAVFVFSAWKTQNLWMPIFSQFKSIWPMLHLL